MFELIKIKILLIQCFGILWLDLQGLPGVDTGEGGARNLDTAGGQVLVQGQQYFLLTYLGTKINIGKFVPTLKFRRHHKSVAKMKTRTIVIHRNGGVCDSSQIIDSCFTSFHVVMLIVLF